MIALAVTSAVLLALRLWAALRVGFGDGEALYAAYAAHPQPVYLDHPGLVGVALRTIGGGNAPTPTAAHVVTALAATAFPWLVVGAARLAGARRAGALQAGLAVAVVPELAVGLFAFTPDLLLAFSWLGALGLFAYAAQRDAKDLRAAVAFLAAGLLVGVATASKVSGACLGLAFVAALFSRPLAAHRRSLWPWAGLLAGAVVVLPVALAEVRLGYPMLRHRLVASQGDAGFSLRNLGALVGGQLAYVSPLLALAGAYVAVDLLRAKAREADAGDRAVDAILGRSLAFPVVFLVPLCLWSRVAEPHWLAPAWLALPLHFARRFDAGDALVSRRLARAGWGLGAACILGVFAWVLVPSLVALTPKDADPRYDLANELYGWPTVVSAVRAEAVTACGGACEPGEPVVVGPHWVVCAQLEAALARIAGAPPVGCATPMVDDFDHWYPRERWKRAPLVLFVTDNRFPVSFAGLFPRHVVVQERTVTIPRADRVGRTFRIVVLGRAGTASR